MVGLLDMKGNESIRRVYDEEGLCPTLTTMLGGHREPKVLVRTKKEPEERWKPIEGYEGHYEISDHGRVKSLERTFNTGRGGHRTIHESIKENRFDKYGYLRITLSKNSKKKTVSIHQLVARHFIDNPKNLPEVNHLDGDKTNNHWTNLEWCTTLKNQEHRKDILRKSGRKPNQPKGVRWRSDRKKWHAVIKHEDHSKHLGYFDTKEEGYKAYFEAFVELNGYAPWDVNQYPEESIEIVKSSNVLIRPCLTPDRVKKRQNGRRFKEDGEPMFTLTAQDIHGVALEEKPNWIPGPDDINRTLRTGGKGSLSDKHNYEHIHDGIRIRKLTPKECWRLQGFPDWAHERAKAAGVSKTQRYKQAGNSVTVNVIQAIGSKLI